MIGRSESRSVWVVLALVSAIAISGCATNARQSAAEPAVETTAVAGDERPVLMPPGCGWRSIWEYDGSAATETPEQALVNRIAWNEANPQDVKAIQGVVFPRTDETLMMKAALRSLPAAVKAAGDVDDIRVEAIDENEIRLGDVKLEKTSSGWNIAETAVIHNTSGLFDCDKFLHGLAGED